MHDDFLTVLRKGTLMIGIVCKYHTIVLAGVSYSNNACLVNTYLFGLVTFQFAAYYRRRERELSLSVLLNC